MSKFDNPIVVLAGGVGAAKFLKGLADVHDPKKTTVIVNTGDDTVLHGLNISPDIDTVIYTLAQAIDTLSGWGLADETWRAMESLEKYAQVRPADSSAAPIWFNLGDKDLATHFYRTARRGEGATASQITAEISKAWGLMQKILPMTDAVVSTIVELGSDSTAGKLGEKISFQEYFVKHHHNLAVRAVHFDGAQSALPNGLAELANAEIIVIAPSNPIVSIGPIRALAGVNESLASKRDQVVAISPIVGGRALKGPADRMLNELGYECSALGVAKLYSQIAGTIIIDDVDKDLEPAIQALGMQCVVTNTIMSTPQISQQLGLTTVQSVIGASR